MPCFCGGGRLRVAFQVLTLNFFGGLSQNLEAGYWVWQNRFAKLVQQTFSALRQKSPDYHWCAPAAMLVLKPGTLLW